MKKRIHYNISEILGKSLTDFNNDIIEISNFPPVIEDMLLSFLKQEYGEYIFLDRERLNFVEQRLNNVEKRLNNFEKNHKKVIIIEEIDMDIAKQKVLEYTKKHKIFDIEELHQNIRCELNMLIKIIDDLKKEGRIVEGD